MAVGAAAASEQHYVIQLGTAMVEEPGHTSLTISTSDVAVAYCLGALHLWAVRPADRPERSRDLVEWVPGQRKIKLAFPNDDAEKRFLAKAEELLPAGSWSWSKLDE